MRRLFYVLPLLAVIAVIAAFVVGLRRDPSILPSTLIGKPLPTFALGPVSSGSEGLSSREPGGRPRIINVFASWCVSCRVEHPLLLALKAQGVPIEGLDWKDKPEDAARFLAKEGDPYVRIGSDPSGRAGIDLGVSGAPETFIVDGAGVVRYKQVGPITPEVWSGTMAPMLARLSGSA